ncbi:MAG: DUF4431 domain-containing protein [Gemmatimonadota bacterium]|nr:DUF4431 domain-containing protein [Gemmatimonadota bacterium]MDH4348769.1 DUF4431 domain-containing protein [Gemmatimonadota bacterium]
MARISIKQSWCLALSLACVRGPAGQATCLHYEPKVEELGGTLQVVDRFGPPNYGEDTTRDERLKVPILRLRAPVDICGDSTSEVNIRAFHGVTEIQLIMPEGQSPPPSLLNRAVKVTGTLSAAVSGHHFTDVLVTVSELDPAR